MQVLTPPRQFATAAEEFQNRLGHAAKPYSRTWSSDDENERISSAADAAEEEGVTRPDKAARHAQAEVETEAGYSSDGTDRQSEVEEAQEKSSSNSTTVLAGINNSRNPKLLCELGSCIAPTVCTGF